MNNFINQLNKATLSEKQILLDQISGAFGMQSPEVMNRAEVQNTHSSMTNVKLMQLIK